MPDFNPTGTALPPTLDVAIVGAGFSGVTCAVQCSWMLSSGRSIGLFSSQAPGRGAAYGCTSPRLLMNGPARAMSAISQDEMDLVKRARVTEHSMIPRRDYSIYLQTLLEEARARHAGLIVYRNEIVDIERGDSGFVLRGSDATTWRAKAVILALGNSAPSSTFLPASLREHPNFVADPWSADPLRVGDALCIGTGLTAMDVVALAEAPGTSVIHLLSRHGRLPEIEDPYACAVDAAQFELDDSSPRAFVRTMRAAVARYTARGGDWRDVLETIRPLSQTIWANWGLRERRRFLRHVAPIWGPLRYRVPPETFAAFARTRGGGRVVVHRGHVSGARTLENGKIAVEIGDGATRRAVAVDYVVNCTGPDDDVTHSTSPLVAKLLERGLACAHPLRMGFDANNMLRLIDANGRTGSLFALGPILRGALYETTAINEIREQARTIAEILAK